MTAPAAARLRRRPPGSAAPSVLAVVALLLLLAPAGASAQPASFPFCSSVNVAFDPPPRGTPPPPLTMNGSRVVNAANGNNVAIRGLNWFGFNVGMGMVDGLWVGGSEAATDFALIAYQLRLLGYNAVRMPFTWHDLEMAPRRLSKECGAVGAAALKQRLVSPGALPGLAAGKRLPGNASPLKKARAGYCNSYLPTSSGYHRLLFAAQAFLAQGIYVVLDYQPMGLEQQAYDLAQFVAGWQKLWRMVACLPGFQSDVAGRVFVDVMNEPDSMGINWEGGADGRPGAHQLYLGAADALWALTPGAVLFFFEGTGQQNYGLNWGNGFVTDNDIITSRRLSDPRPFFRDLLTKPYVDKVAFTPHVYPPSVTQAAFLGTTLWDQCRTAFGHLQAPGFCDAGQCRPFPVIVGEVGSAFEGAKDLEWMEDFADFVNAQGAARAYNRVPLNGWLWWAYNQNSGDTGGIVRANWQELDWTKLDWMVASLGLKPWYLRGS